MSEKEKDTILGNELDMEQLKNIAGGLECSAPENVQQIMRDKGDSTHCVMQYYRQPGDCARYVTDSPHCMFNDSCSGSAVIYDSLMTRHNED